MPKSANAKRSSLRVHGKIDTRGMPLSDDICVEWVGENWMSQCQ